MATEPLSRQRFSWRGIEVPVLRRSLGFSHETVPHQFQYARGSKLELTAGGNMRLRYTLAMNDGVTKPPYVQLFSAVWIRLFDAMRNREAGTLFDPVFGELRAKPLTFQDEATSAALTGTEVDVEFEEDPDLEEIQVDLPEDGSSDGLIAESHGLDREIAKQAWDQGAPQQISSEVVNWEQAEPPEPTINPIDLVSGLIRQGSRVVSKTKAIYGDTVFRLEKLEAAIDEARDPALFSLKSDTRRLRLLAMRAFSRQQSASRPLRVTQLPRDMDPMTAAQFVGLSYSEFSRLNTRLASLLFLEQGTRVSHFK